MFAKSTLATAVAAAIGVSAVGVAQADSVFFPYAALSETVTTIVSVINTSANNWNQAGAPAATHLHYRFYYKSGEDADDNLATCEEYDEYLPTSQYDIQTIDLSGHFGSDTAGVIFNDPSINNDWASTQRDYAFGRNVMPARGYLYVDNSDASADSTLSGEAFVFEFGSGAAWGYQAYGAGAGSDFTAAASASPTNVAIMPFEEITTAYFVTPVSRDQAPDLTNGRRARIEFMSGDTLRGDLYDRDENLISGTTAQDVVCVGRVDAVDMMSEGTLARLADGGWAKLYAYRVVKNGDEYVAANFNLASEPTADALDPAGDKRAADDGAVVFKLEYNTEGSGFAGDTTVTNVYNNGIMLRPAGAQD